jgi:hypothetical protein
MTFTDDVSRHARYYREYKSLLTTITVKHDINQVLELMRFITVIADTTGKISNP